MAHIGGKITMKVLTIAVGIPIGIATRRAVERVWIVAGPDHPREASDESERWADVIAWAVLTAVGMSLANLMTRKGAEEIYRTVLGSKPPVTAKPSAWKRVRTAEPKYPKEIAPPS